MKNLTCKIRTIVFLKYFADALYSSFLILFLKSEGYDGVKLAILMALVPLIAIISNIVLSFLANSMKRNKGILILLLCLNALGIGMLILAKNNFALSLISICLISLANNPSFNLEEGLTSSYTIKEGKNYSFTRVCGSLGYLVALFALYFIDVKSNQYSTIFLISAGIFFLLSVCWFFLPNLKLNFNNQNKVKEVLKRKEFWFYFIMYFLFFGAFNSLEYYISDYVVTMNNYNDSAWSLFYALAILLEAITIFIVGKFVKEKDYKKGIIIALILLIIRSVLLTINLSRTLIPFLIIFRGIGWGFFLALHIKNLVSILNDELKASAVLLLSVGQGIVSSLLNLVGGYLINHYSYQIFFFLISITMFVSFVFYLGYNLFINRRGKKMRINQEVENALKNNLPVVALESTIISHGMPYPKNVETALKVEAVLRSHGVVPATIGIINGEPVIGMTPEEIENFGKREGIYKVSRRDLPYIIANKEYGATTVATTMLLAEKAGIKVFVTGGVGGVHRGAESNFDISADLIELSSTAVIVVCAGVKAILDLEKTLEVLETLGVTVIGYKSDNLGDFYTPDSGFKIDVNMDTPLKIAKAMKVKEEYNLRGGLLVSNPIEKKYQMDKKVIDDAISLALKEADEKGIKGKDITPFLLQRIVEITHGDSLEANIALVLNNAHLGAEIAKEYVKL